MRNRFAVQDGVERLAQIRVGGLRALFAEILDAVVDAAEVQHLAIG